MYKCAGTGLHVTCSCSSLHWSWAHLDLKSPSYTSDVWALLALDGLPLPGPSNSKDSRLDLPADTPLRCKPTHPEPPTTPSIHAHTLGHYYLPWSPRARCRIPGTAPYPRACWNHPDLPILSLTHLLLPEENIIGFCPPFPPTSAS